MEILFLDEIDSTQEYLARALKSGSIQPPIAVTATLQTKGIGSRGAKWNCYEGNLFFSFALTLQDMPSDIPQQSFSLYFVYLLKEMLRESGSELWMKWPNDLYIEDKKIGGCITSLYADNIVCGIGLNTRLADEEFAVLDICDDNFLILEDYLSLIERGLPWSAVSSGIRQEFQTHRVKFLELQKMNISTQDIDINEDGSLTVDGKKVYSLR